METVLRLDSGFAFDFSNLYGPGRVAQADMASIADRLNAAHSAVERMRATGVVEGHLSKDGAPELVLFTQLPYVQEGNLNTPSSVRRLLSFGEGLRHHTDAVVSFGIGGSFLGNKVLFDVQCGEFWNSKDTQARNGWPKCYFSGNNIDPRRTSELLAQLLAEAKSKAASGSYAEPYRVLLIVISKSGATLDTMSTFMVMLDALQAQAPEIEVAVAVVTGPPVAGEPTLLGRLAAERNWPVFAVPDGVGGRFSVFSEVGLLLGACVGFDIEAFLAGARSMDEACRTPEVRRNPALWNAALKYLAAQRCGCRTEIFMPYGDYLKSTAEWYVQLLAESLGKRLDRSGREAYYGRTPVVAVGTTDMHAQTQLHQDGPRDKVVQFVQVDRWAEDPLIPDLFPAVPKLTEISGLPMSRALDAALASNATALAADGRLTATFHLPELNAFHLGELLYMLALSIAYEGELAGVDAFDQPGVEAYKKILGPLLQEQRRVRTGC